MGNKMKLNHLFPNHWVFKHQLKQYSILYYLFLGILPLTAQPSGGPYGPIRQTYEIPDVPGKVYYVAPDGNAEASGESLAKPTTIEAAIMHVKSGDAIVLRGGIYRTGNLVFNQGIIIQPYKYEEPVLKGTYVATEWEQQENDLWVTTWEYLFPQKPDGWWRRYRHGSDIPLHRFNNDMVFVDGRFLQSAGWEGELDENSCYIDYEAKKIYLSLDPHGHEVEITAFNVGLLRSNGKVNGKKSDGKGPVVRGITFTQYAYRAVEIMGSFPEKLSPESGHGKDVTGSTFEHCTFSYCSRVAGYFYGDHLTIRNCKVSDTSTEGLYVLSSSDVLLEKNILTRNNIEHLQGYYPSAVKIFNQCYRVTCRDNLVIDHENSIGIWYDVGNVDGMFINNWLENIHYDETHRKPPDSILKFQEELYVPAMCLSTAIPASTCATPRTYRCIKTR
jgi:parallel beta-helix repeat protein